MADIKSHLHVRKRRLDFQKGDEKKRRKLAVNETDAKLLKVLDSPPRLNIPPVLTITAKQCVSPMKISPMKTSETRAEALLRLSREKYRQPSIVSPSASPSPRKQPQLEKFDTVVFTSPQKKLRYYYLVWRGRPLCIRGIGLVPYVYFFVQTNRAARWRGASHDIYIMSLWANIERQSDWLQISCSVCMKKYTYGTRPLPRMQSGRPRQTNYYYYINYSIMRVCIIIKLIIIMYNCNYVYIMCVSMLYETL